MYIYMGTLHHNAVIRQLTLLRVTAGGMSKFVALLPNSMQIVHNWSKKVYMHSNIICSFITLHESLTCILHIPFHADINLYAVFDNQQQIFER